MARYIDADKLIEHLKDEIKACEPVFDGRANGKSIAYGTELGLKSAISFAETLATVDVAPKSEVKKYAQIHKYIFETITEGCDYETAEAYEKAYNKELSKLVDHTTTKSEVAREIFEEIDKTVFADMDFFKELKKKYTEDKII